METVASEAGPDASIQRPSDRSVGDRLKVNKKLDLLFRLKQFPEGQTNQARYLRNVREMGREMSQAIVDNTPKCRDQTEALRCVRQAMLWAQEAVLREGIV